ncbi:MAG: TIGR03808 family TAT-translocated repetitive protein [Lentilitoribacter sp.]
MANPKFSRRQILAGLLATTGVVAVPSYAQNSNSQLLNVSGLRGGIDATDRGLLPDVVGDQSKLLLDAIVETAATNQVLYIPAGNYYISNIDLPDNARIQGVPGATRLVYTGRGHGIIGENLRRLEIKDIILDGANNSFGTYTNGLLNIRGCGKLFLDNISVLGSSKYGISLERCGGVIQNCDLAGAADAALFSVEGLGLTIRNNYVHDCANGGILVHRWAIGEDNTIISGNRIERILAQNGGTGPFGNGINVFRAGNVMINDNHISDCSFSAIRANSASNIHITGNSCYGSGETALYVEFAFQGAVVTGNLIDGGTMGISIANFNKDGRLSTITGNLIRNITDQGPYITEGSGFGHGIAVEADASVTGNTIENAAKTGMLVGWGPYLRSVSITGNVIRKAPMGIAVSVVEGSQSTAIFNNVFDQTPGGAIVGHRWKEPVTRDLARRAKSGFDHLSIGNNVVN